MTIEQIDLVAMVGETVDIPCDVNGCDPRPARWIVWTNHQCEDHPRTGFMCDPCLQRAATRARAVWCTRTGETFTPGRLWLNRFERIDKPTTTLPLSS